MFLITLQQVSILIFYILLGFALCKAKIVGKEGSRVLSKLLVCVFLPAYTISNLSNNVSIENIIQYAVVIGCGVAIMLLAVGFAFIVSKFFAKDKQERGIYQYVLAFGNITYFGCPLISAVFGAEVLATYMLFCLPISIGINTYGYFILTQVEFNVIERQNRKKEMLKRAFSIPTIATLVGIILGLMPFTMPEIFYSILTPAGNCMSASAMILAGIVLAGCSFKELFCSVKSYIASFIRLFICPLIFGGVAFVLYKFAGLGQDVFICILASSCFPAGMNSIVFPESVGLSGKSGAKVCFVSYIIALGAVPLWFEILKVLL